MRKYDEFHPFVNFIFYCVIIGFLCFQHNPFFTLVGLLGVILSNMELHYHFHKKEITAYVVLFLLLGILNPLFQHSGETILCYVNEKAITVEALFYGFHMGLILVVTLLWCRQFSKQFHEEQIMFLIGRFSQKSALILSMSFKWIPMFRRQSEAIKSAQIAMGTYRNETLLERVISNLRIFSATITWALEHSIQTADSMKARGYHTGKRGHLSTYQWKKKDGVLGVGIGILFGFLMIEYVRGIHTVYYYPKMNLGTFSVEFVLNLIAFLFLLLMPSCIRIHGQLRISQGEIGIGTKNKGSAVAFEYTTIEETR